MHTRTEVPPSLLRLADDQHGVVTRSAMLAEGLSRNVVTRLSDEWTHLARGVYAIPGDYDRWLQMLYAGLALGGPGAAAWGATALALWDLGDRPRTIEILTAKTRAAPVTWLRFRRDAGGLRRIVDLDPSRVALDDAVLDAAADASRHDALAVVSRTLQESRTTPERLRRALQGRTRLRHRGLLIDAIGDSADGAHSSLEHLYLRTVERAHGLPPMLRQYRVPQTGHTADGAYVDAGVLIELDGVRFHDRRADRILDNRHGVLGHRTFRFEWSEVDCDPCAVARTVASAIGFASLSRCRRCPPAAIGAPVCGCTATTQHNRTS